MNMVPKAVITVSMLNSLPIVQALPISLWISFGLCDLGGFSRKRLHRLVLQVHQDYCMGIMSVFFAVPYTTRHMIHEIRIFLLIRNMWLSTFLWRCCTSD